MFNKRPKTYSVFINQQADEPLENIVLLPDGFRFWAFLFPPIWALYHQAWRLLFIAIGFNLLIYFLQNVVHVNFSTSQMLSLGFQLWVGIDANDWRIKSLQKRGYHLADVVIATTELAAHQRFLDRYINNLNELPLAKNASSKKEEDMLPEMLR